jgi:hypothetical protein
VLEESEQMDRASAEQYIRHVDGVRARWVKTMYDKDVEDPVLYDMVVNLKTLTVPGICAVVVGTLQRPEFTVTDDVRARFTDFRLACRVKAALASASETRALSLEVEARGGRVEISGSAPVLASGQTGDQIAEIARAVPGVEETHLKVEWFDPYP